MYHVPTNSNMINMCLSISDLLNFSRRFEELVILFIEFVFDFFICSSLRLRLKIFPGYMKFPIKTSKRFTFFNLCLDSFLLLFFMKIIMKKCAPRTYTKLLSKDCVSEDKWMEKATLDWFHGREEGKDARKSWHFLKEVIVWARGEMCELGEDGRVKNNLVKRVALSTEGKQKESKSLIVWREREDWKREASLELDRNISEGCVTFVPLWVLVAYSRVAGSFLGKLIWLTECMTCWMWRSFPRRQHRR